MGGFLNDMAHGHGTYYLWGVGKRVMAVWARNEIVLDSGYII